jgi:hypothetical protein
MTAQLPIYPMSHEAHQIRFMEMEAKYWSDGFYAPSDFRYYAMYLFANASPSFQAVASSLRGKPTTLPMPSDFAAVEDIYKNFFLEIGPKTPQTNESIARMQKIRGPRTGRSEKLPVDGATGLTVKWQNEVVAIVVGHAV